MNWKRSIEDKEYWFNRAHVDIFKDKAADPSLLVILESALGDNDEVEIEWEKPDLNKP